jgi:hypothetical protein
MCRFRGGYSRYCASIARYGIPLSGSLIRLRRRCRGSAAPGGALAVPQFRFGALPIRFRRSALATTRFPVRIRQLGDVLICECRNFHGRLTRGHFDSGGLHHGRTDRSRRPNRTTPGRSCSSPRRRAGTFDDTLSRHVRKIPFQLRIRTFYFSPDDITFESNLSIVRIIPSISTLPALTARALPRAPQVIQVHLSARYIPLGV